MMRYAATIVRNISFLALAVVMLAAATPNATAQSTKIIVTVNEDIITNVDVEQRRLLILFASGGKAPNPEKLAMRGLIEDALKLQEAKRLRVKVKPAEIEGAIATIARRNRITKDRLLEALKSAGIDPDTFRHQLHAQIAWNKVIRGRYGKRLVPTAGEIEAAMATSASPEDIYVLKQIVIDLPKGAPKADVDKAAASAAKARAAMKSCDDVAKLAPKYSKVSGDVGKLKLKQLPPPIRAQVVSLAVGGVTKPVRSNRGLHLIIVCDITRAGGASRKKVAAILRQKKGIRISKSYVQDLRRNALITRAR